MTTSGSSCSPAVEIQPCDACEFLTDDADTVTKSSVEQVSESGSNEVEQQHADDRVTVNDVISMLHELYEVQTRYRMLESAWANIKAGVIQDDQLSNEVKTTLIEVVFRLARKGFPLDKLEPYLDLCELTLDDELYQG